MKKLLILLTICILGSSGAAFAQNLLTNGDAEFGDLTGWTVNLGNPAAVLDCGFPPTDPTIDTGLYAFSMDQCNTQPGTFDGSFYYAQISQTVDTTGCNVLTDLGELTGGTYSMTTRYKAGGDDTAIYGVTFRDAGFGLLDSFSTETDPVSWLFNTGVTSGLIPAGAAFATVELGGKGVPGTDPNPGTYHDNVVYEFTSCIAAYAVTAGKTSCTGGNESQGGGDGNGSFIAISDCDGDNGTPGFSIVNGPNTVTFSGAMFVEAQIGLMDGTGAPDSPETFPYVGTPTPGSFITFKSKNPKVTAYCVLTPGAGATVTITDTDWFINDILWDHHCEDINGGMIDAALWGIPTGAFNGLGGKGRDKDRGTFYLSSLIFDLARGWSDTYEN